MHTVIASNTCFLTACPPSDISVVTTDFVSAVRCSSAQASDSCKTSAHGLVPIQLSQYKLYSVRVRNLMIIFLSCERN